jgi:hypothetical protein
MTTLSDLSEQTLLVEFAGVLDEYTSAQRELLGFLQQFRAQYLTPPAGPTPGWPPVARRCAPFPGSERPSPASASVTRSLAPPPRALRAWHDDVFGTSVLATKRDYNYFTELDERLGQLRPARARVNGYDGAIATTGSAGDRPAVEP